ncbi:MAG: hypothetical protein K2X42_05880, partial [Burkholderiaceae bacterium]|nr:hypothetical protein [Burkholderiaceae bacterium]
SSAGNPVSIHHDVKVDLATVAISVDAITSDDVINAAEKSALSRQSAAWSSVKARAAVDSAPRVVVVAVVAVVAAAVEVAMTAVRRRRVQGAVAVTAAARPRDQARAVAARHPVRRPAMARRRRVRVRQLPQVDRQARELNRGARVARCSPPVRPDRSADASALEQAAINRCSPRRVDQSKRRSLNHLVATHFSPSSTDAPPCSVRVMG